MMRKLPLILTSLNEDFDASHNFQASPWHIKPAFVDPTIHQHTHSAPMLIDDQWYSNMANQDATIAIDKQWWGPWLCLILTILVKLNQDDTYKFSNLIFVHKECSKRMMFHDSTGQPGFSHAVFLGTWLGCQNPGLPSPLSPPKQQDWTQSNHDSSSTVSPPSIPLQRFILVRVFLWLL